MVRAVQFDQVDQHEIRPVGLLLALGFLEDPHDVASFMMRYSTPSILTSVPDHLPNRTRLPTCTSSGTSLPPRRGRPAYGDDFPLGGFFLAVSGMMMPPALLSSGIDALDDDAVVKRTKLHAVLLSD